VVEYQEEASNKTGTIEFYALIRSFDEVEDAVRARVVSDVGDGVLMPLVANGRNTPTVASAVMFTPTKTSPRRRTIPIAVDQTIEERFASSGEEHIITFSIDLTREYNIFITGTNFSRGPLQVEHGAGFVWLGSEFRDYNHDSIRRGVTASGASSITGILTHGGAGQAGRGNYRIVLTSTRADVEYSVRLEMNLDEGEVTGADFNSAVWRPRDIVGVNQASALRVRERIFIARESIPEFYLRVLDDEFVSRQSDIVSFFMSLVTVYAFGGSTLTRLGITKAIESVRGSARIISAAGAMGVSTWTLAQAIESFIPDLTLRGMIINSIRGHSGLVIPNTREDREIEASHGLIIDQTFSLLTATQTIPTTAGMMPTPSTGNLTVFSRWNDFPNMAGVRGWRDTNGFDLRRGGTRRGNIHPVTIRLI